MNIAGAAAVGPLGGDGPRVTLTTASAVPDEAPPLMAFRFGGVAGVMQREGTVEVGIPLPVLNGGQWIERWHAGGPVQVASHDAVTTARANGLRLAATAPPQGSDESMEVLGRRAYEQVLGHLRGDGWHLLRFWNFLPAINTDEAGLERYRRFTLGRYEAFKAEADIDTAGFPAASALGGRDGPTIVLGMSTRQTPLHLENPRQTSAYHYPVHYGPRSPSFARATWLPGDDGGLLLVSGTASIVGHRSLHYGDVSAQTAETVANLRRLLTHAHERTGHRLALTPGQATLRVYLREPEHLPAVQRQLENEGIGDVPAVFLRADICRRELLMEIEGVVSTATH